MDKAVLISIHPEWCEEIILGKKTMEVRKNRPTLDVPFKAYIYCTKAPKGWLRAVPGHGWQQLDGKVIGEFVCDDVRRIGPEYCIIKEDIESAITGSCLTVQQVRNYAGWKPGTSYADLKDLYSWHISDLKIYDQPKPMTEFSQYGFCGMNGTNVCGNEACKHYQPSGSYMLPPTCAINGCCLSKPPQSWCYVAEAEEDDAL